jgi:DNA adenine methylase
LARVRSSAPGLPQPFLKWAGSKRAVMEALRPLFPAAGEVGTYVEPFLGGGSVALFVLQKLRPKRAVLADRNPDLINAFTAVRDDVEALIELLQAHEARHRSKYYYAVRAKVPETATERAARLIYLNKTCYNGLYRLNRRGLFNVPLGRQRTCLIVDIPALREVSALLQGVELVAGSFEQTLVDLGPGDLTYLDPPYDPVSQTSYFTNYDGQPFRREDQARLAERAREVASTGCRVIASNSDTPFVRSLYPDFAVHELQVLRRISRNADGRTRAGEVVLVSPG